MMLGKSALHRTLHAHGHTTMMSVFCLFALKARDSSEHRSAVLDSLTPWLTSVAAMSQHVPSESPAAAAAPEEQGGAAVVAEAAAEAAVEAVAPEMARALPVDENQAPLAAAADEPPPAVADEGVPPPPVPKHQKRQYSGCWSHTELTGRKAPKHMAKKEFGELLWRLLEAGFREEFEKKRRRMKKALKGGVWEEKHANGELHYHFTLLADGPWSKDGLDAKLKEQGIFVFFTADHDYYWTSVVYVAVPGTEPGMKKEEDLDPQPWLSPGHPSIVDTLLDMPRGARQSDKNRVRRYLAEPEGRGASNDSQTSFSDKEFANNVVALGLRTKQQLLAWIEERAQKLKVDRRALPLEQRLVVVGLESYVFKHQHDIQARLVFAWEKHDAPKDVADQARSAIDFISAARTETQCTCGGRWKPLTEELLTKQVQKCQDMYRTSSNPNTLVEETPHSAVVRYALRRCLQEGCQKHVNVFFHGPRSSGKSHVTKGLETIFGKYAFRRPVGKGSFLMQELFGKKVCVLQDVRPGTFSMDWDSLLVWWEGEEFLVPLPQGKFTGHRLYNEKAGVFATAGQKLRISAAAAQEAGVDPTSQNEMMDERFRYFLMPRKLLKSEVVQMDPCTRCSAEWVLTGDDVAPPPVLPVVEATGAQPMAQGTAGPEAVDGLQSLLNVARLAETHAKELGASLASLGVVHVSELSVADWAGLAVWNQLLEFQRRRILKHCQPAC